MTNKGRKALVFAISALMVVVSFVFMSTAVAAVPASSSTSTPSGEFIWGTPISTSVSDLNPLTATSSLGTILVGEMYADTLGMMWNTGAVSPWLAQSWNEVDNANGTLSITYHLNPNADWVNGTSVVGEITSKDVAFTFNVLKANASLDGYGIGPHILSITTPNLTTVTFLMNTQSSLWFDILSTQVIIPSAWLTYTSGNYSNIGSFENMGPLGQEITAGPFVLSTINSEGGILNASTHFWMGTPKLAQILVEKFTSTASLGLSLEKGTIDGSVGTLSDYHAFSTKSYLTNLVTSSPDVFYLWGNDQKYPFSNVHVRRALAYAINKTQVMVSDEDSVGTWGPNNVSFGGLPAVLKSDWAPNLTYYAYNTTNAEAQFEAGGFHIASGGPYAGFFVNNTTGALLNFTVQDPPISDWIASATSIVDDLAAVHVQATLSIVPFSTWGSTVFNYSNFNVLSYFGYVPAFANPYLQLQQIYDTQGFWNFENILNKTLNADFNASANVSNQTNLVKSLYPAQRLIDSLVPIINIGNAGSYTIYNNKLVGGFLTNVGIGNPVSFMSTYLKSVSPSPSALSPTLYYAIGGVVVAAIAVIGGAVYWSTKHKKKGEK